MNQKKEIGGGFVRNDFNDVNNYDFVRVEVRLRIILMSVVNREREIFHFI